MTRSTSPKGLADAVKRGVRGVPVPLNVLSHLSDLPVKLLEDIWTGKVLATVGMAVVIDRAFQVLSEDFHDRALTIELALNPPGPEAMTPELKEIARRLYTKTSKQR
jgi:hypothetical protein